MENHRWYIGMPIVAVRNHSKGRFKKGDEFVVKGIKQGCCSLLLDIGIKLDGEGIRWRCTCCNAAWETKDLTGWYSERNFLPLDFDISELTKILEEPIQEKINLQV